MASPYRDLSWMLIEHQECSCSCPCSKRFRRFTEEAPGVLARRRLHTLVLLLVVVLAGTAIAYQCVETASAIARSEEATRQFALGVAADRTHPMAPRGRHPVPPAARARPAPPFASAPMPSRCQSDTARCRVEMLVGEGGGIVRVSETEFLVNRRLIDLILEKQPASMHAILVVPSSVNGKTFPRVFGIKPDSLLGTLGLRDGDYVERVNGHSLSSPDGTLEAYSGSRSSDVITLDLKRDGRSFTMKYDIF